MTPQAGLFLSATAFVGLHFLLSHPLRDASVRKLGERGFQGVYSVIALLTFGLMIYFYGRIGREPPIWTLPEWAWAIAALVMWLGAILFVGSFLGNPALPGARLERGKAPGGVFAITRHPMMWGFALWAATHAIVNPTQASLILCTAIAFLALVGAAAQDAKKLKLMGPVWQDWRSRTSFIPYGRGLKSADGFALLFGTLLWLGATWAHAALGGRPAGVWAFLG